MIFGEIETNLLPTVVDHIHNSDVLMAQIFGKGQRTRRSKPWAPPVYTNLRGFMLLNYLVLACAAAFVGLVIWWIV